MIKNQNNYILTDFEKIKRKKNLENNLNQIKGGNDNNIKEINLLEEEKNILENNIKKLSSEKNSLEIKLKGLTKKRKFLKNYDTNNERNIIKL